MIRSSSCFLALALRVRWRKSSNRDHPIPADIHLIALRLQVSRRITIAEEYDLLVARTAERFVAASHRLSEPAKDAEIQELPDLGEQREVALDPCVTTR